MSNEIINKVEEKFENTIPYLELKGVTKDYGHVRALDNVDFKIFSHEIVGLVGDNGAGKSTLIKIMSGIVKPDNAQIFVNGQETKIKSSKDALRIGVETIYQDMNLIDSMNVMRNIFAGREEVNRFGVLKLNKMTKKSMKLLEEDVSIEGIQSPYQLVRNLSGGQKQAVSIARAMFFKKKILLLDEPTSALSIRETNAFLDYIIKLRDEGLSIVLVTHSIYYAFKVSNRFVLLSHGKKVLDVLKKDTNVDELTKNIVVR
jgi:simple sugar transport system ATP-binding protein